ncbi:protein serine/threonine kinase [Pelomyxa schiedti]|nr:protein serine/threonine kinase [Pelomyxa schiedti]
MSAATAGSLGGGGAGTDDNTHSHAPSPSPPQPPLLLVVAKSRDGVVGVGGTAANEDEVEDVDEDEKEEEDEEAAGMSREKAPPTLPQPHQKEGRGNNGTRSNDCPLLPAPQCSCLRKKSAGARTMTQPSSSQSCDGSSATPAASSSAPPTTTTAAAAAWGGELLPVTMATMGGGGSGGWRWCVCRKRHEPGAEGWLMVPPTPLQQSRHADAVEVQGSGGGISGRCGCGCGCGGGWTRGYGVMSVTKPGGVVETLSLVVYANDTPEEREKKPFTRISLTDPHTLASAADAHVSRDIQHIFCIKSAGLCSYLAAESDIARDNWISTINCALFKYFPKEGKERMKCSILTFLAGFYHHRVSLDSVLKILPPDIIQSIARLLFQEVPVLLSDFNFLRVIGKGSFGEVSQMEHIPSKKFFAMKRASFEINRSQEQVVHELVDHPFLVKLHHCYRTSKFNYFILDYVTGGELFYHLAREKKFSASVVKLWAAETLLALEHLHSLSIIYRGIKPENLLLTKEGHIVVVDFGEAKLCYDEQATKPKTELRTDSLCGTPDYLAPEILERVPYGQSVDWWAFGVLLFELRAGLPPFYSESIQDMYQRVMHDSPVFPAHFEAEETDLIGKLLNKNPAKRLSDPQLMKQHPYFHGISWPDVLHKAVTPLYVPQQPPGSADNRYLEGIFDDVFTQQPPTASDPSFDTDDPFYGFSD